MPTESSDLNLERVRIVRHIVAQLRERASGRKDCDSILDDVKTLAGPSKLARDLLGDAHRRSNLKRVAFPNQELISKPWMLRSLVGIRFRLLIALLVQQLSILRVEGSTHMSAGMSTGGLLRRRTELCGSYIPPVASHRTTSNISAAFSARPPSSSCNSANRAVRSEQPKIEPKNLRNEDALKYPYVATILAVHGDWRSVSRYPRSKGRRSCR